MKIAIAAFTEFPAAGAVPHRIQMMARGLAAQGHRVQVVVPLKFETGPFTAQMKGIGISWGGQVNRRNAENYLVKLLKRLWLFKRTYQLMAQGLDWLILYDMGLDGLPLLLLANKYKCRVAAENCDVRLISHNPLKDTIIKYSFGIAHRCLAPRYRLNLVVSTYLKKRLDLLARGVPP